MIMIYMEGKFIDLSDLVIFLLDLILQNKINKVYENKLQFEKQLTKFMNKLL